MTSPSRRPSAASAVTACADWELEVPADGRDRPSRRGGSAVEQAAVDEFHALACRRPPASPPASAPSARSKSSTIAATSRAAPRRAGRPGRAAPARCASGSCRTRRSCGAGGRGTAPVQRPPPRVGAALRGDRLARPGRRLRFGPCRRPQSRRSAVGVRRQSCAVETPEHSGVCRMRRFHAVAQIRKTVPRRDPPWGSPGT